MRAIEFITENKTTLNKLYNGNFPDRDESFWDEVRPHEFDNPLEIRTMPKHKLAIMIQSQYRVEHLDELLDMMDEDQQEILQRYMNDPNLSNKIILLSGDRIIDGNHRALAAAMKGVPINYVDLADLDEQDVAEGTSNIPQYLYHATYRPLLKSIKTHGLGGSGAQAKWEDSKPGVTYLALDADVAESYAESSDVVPDEWLDKIVILKISTRGLDTSKFKLDSNVLDNEGDTLEYHGVIPISNISVVKRDIDEMALAKYQTFGDFTKPGPFRGADKKLVPHPKNIEKATRFFEQTPYDFRLFFSNVPGTGKYSEHGPMSPEQIKQIFGEQASEIIDGSEDAITVVYVGNKGDSKVMLTPWMMAHRFGHAINAGARNKNWTAWGEAENYFFQTVNNLLDEHYGKVPATKPPGRNMLFQLTPEYNALFNAMGTQRSSKAGQIRRPYEFLYELFAQYLGTGKVTLNPLPTNLGYGRRVFGNPTKYMNIKPEYRDEGERKQAADSLAYTMELLFNDVLSDSVGKIFVM